MYKLIQSLIEDIVQENVVYKILGEFKDIAYENSFSCLEILSKWEVNESVFSPNNK